VVDETTVNDIERYEESGLPERAKVALRFCDAILGWPRGITDDLRDDLRRHFTDAQIVELALDVLKWSNQKVRVALGLDAVAAGDARFFEIAADGSVDETAVARTVASPAQRPGTAGTGEGGAPPEAAGAIVLPGVAVARPALATSNGPSRPVRDIACETDDSSPTVAVATAGS
jgi:hypothetical protein